MLTPKPHQCPASPRHTFRGPLLSPLGDCRMHWRAFRHRSEDRSAAQVSLCKHVRVCRVCSLIPYHPRPASTSRPNALRATSRLAAYMRHTCVRRVARVTSVRWGRCTCSVTTISVYFLLSTLYLLRTAASRTLCLAHSPSELMHCEPSQWALFQKLLPQRSS